MASDLLDLLCRATNEMRDFLRREKHMTLAHPEAVSADAVKSLAARLREVGEATRIGRPEEVAWARASSAYCEYKELLAQVHMVLRPLRERLEARQSEIDTKQTQIQAVRGWTAAYRRTR
ncbi:MAG TPA: hypothetical protein VMD78_11890 [Candidatus Baltobacteraceae bacterium]|nr:hypothetical protein [Candidatus Baltobacteraceae bacterium]